MKYSRIILITLIVLLLLSIPSMAQISNLIQAYLVDYDISYGKSLNSSLSYPIISYNDNTYMAVRDVAFLWNKDITWNQEYKSINFVSREKKENIIKKEETALKIGKAILEEYFTDKIKENSAYHVTYAEPDGIDAEDVWRVSVIFDASGAVNDDYILSHPDAIVQINPLTCNFCVSEVQTNGEYVNIVDYKKW